jgi:hypothetical protein
MMTIATSLANLWYAPIAGKYPGKHRSQQVLQNIVFPGCIKMEHRIVHESTMPAPHFPSTPSRLHEDGMPWEACCTGFDRHLPALRLLFSPV